MSIDRAKALKAAQKYLAKGQLDRAITEYEKVVAADPDDPRSLLKLGDLYTRTRDNKGAITSYRKVAQQYAKQGFFLKAVAVCKQILKLDPSDLAATESLGEMYEMLSLTSDALATYEQVADAYLAAGKGDRALKALRKIAELDPENVAAWIRAAEALSKADQIDEAAEAFRRGADLLKRQDRVDDYIKVTERLLFHSHEDLDRARELAGIYIERGQAKAALAHLQTCFKANPIDVPTLVLLAQAFHGLAQTGKAVAVYKELARIHAEAGRGEDELATLHALLALEPGNPDARRRVEALSSAAQPVNEQAVEVVDEELDEVVIVDEEPENGSQPFAATFAAPERNAKIARMMAECEVFTRYGLRDKVIAQLNRVLDLDPEHVEAREKLKDALLKRGEVGSAVMQLLLLSESAAKQDPARAGTYLEEAASLSPDNEAVKARLAELRGSIAPVPSAATEDEDEVVFVDEEEDETDFGDLRSAPPRQVGPREVSLATQLEGSEDNVELAFEDDGDGEPELTLEAGEEGEEEQEQAEEPQEPELAAAEPEAEPATELEPELVEALGEADFYLAQKLPDEAREVVMEALDAHPEHPALLAKLAAIDADAGGAEVEPIEDRSFVLAEKLAVEASSGTQAPENVEQVLKQFKAGIAQQVDKSDTATHHDLGIAYMEMGLHAEAIEQFKLCLGHPDKQCLAHTMLGLCYAAKGEPPNAIEHFRRALQSPMCTDAERLGLWFELGQSHERLGKPKEALGWYEQVASKDPSFRDVSTRIERLGRKQGGEEDGDFDAMFDNMIVKD